MGILSKFFRRTPKEDPHRVDQWHLVFYDEYGWGATYSQIPLGQDKRSVFAEELANTSGRQMLVSRGYRGGGTYDFSVRNRQSLIDEGGWRGLTL